MTDSSPYGPEVLRLHEQKEGRLEGGSLRMRGKSILGMI